MQVILWIVASVAGVFALAALGLFGIRLLTRKLAREAVAEIGEKFPVEQIKFICPNANFIGIASKGMKQLRGNGTLVLMPERIYFLMWVPRQEHEIPLRAVTGTEIVSSHLGKTFFRPLVRVSFTNENGEPDSVAWLTDDAQRWSKEIKKAVCALL